MGRNKIPDDVKEKKGTLQKSRIQKVEFEPELLCELPKPPTFLNKHAKSIYYSTGAVLINEKIIAEVDLPMFHSYCMEMGTYIECEILLKKEGKIMKSPNGYKQVNPLVAIRTQSLSSAMKLAAAFGLTPTTKIKVAPLKKDKPKESKILSILGDSKNVKNK